MNTLTDAQVVHHVVALQNTFLFRGIAAEEIAEMISRAGVYETRTRVGEPLLRQETVAPCLHILLRGVAAVSKTTGGVQFHVSELRTGAIFGMAALFAEKSRRYPTGIVAKEACLALTIEETAFRELLREDARVLENYLRYLTGRIHFLNARIESLIRPGAKERVLLYIRQNAPENTLTHGLTAMAQALNIGRATLYRALDALEAEGAIARNGKHIRLLSTQDDDLGE